MGRERELGSLGAALDEAAAGACRVVLLVGAAGVGKSALMQALRPLVHARGGRFVAGKFDPHEVAETAAVQQAMGALGRLLLDERDEEGRARLRSRILRSVGPHAALARVVPELAQLLGDVPDSRTADPAHVAARMAQFVVGLLRAVASKAQPLVMALDDLQWGGALTIRLIDAVLASAADLPGLLLISSFRDEAPPAEHPLAAALPRWAAAQGDPQLLAIPPLQVHQVAQLVTQMVDMDSPRAQQLAQVLAPHAAGNPYDTVELVNALRDAGLLGTTAQGSGWDGRAVHAFLRSVQVQGVIAARIARLPARAQELLRALACMGAQASRNAARVAIAADLTAFDEALALLGEQGFVLRGQDIEQPARSAQAAPRLRHDRIQQAAYASLPPAQRGAFHLELARRLSTHDVLAFAAAEQYVHAVDSIHDQAERRQAARLLRHAAGQLRLTGNHLAAVCMLGAALRLLEDSAQVGPDAALAGCEIECHLALHSVGRLEEADAMYERIAARGLSVLDRVDAACAQVSSLMNRNRMDSALALGKEVLCELGLPVPQVFADQDFERCLEAMRRWVESCDLDRDSVRAEASLPDVVASAKMIERLMWVAVFADLRLLAWLALQSQDIWEKHGPCAPLLVGISQAAIATIPLGRDWRTGYLAARHAVDVCEARGWEPEASQARYMLALNCIHWFEPIERRLSEAERAREGLLAGGDLRNAGFSCRQSALALFECAPTLRQFEHELTMAVSIAQRAGNIQALARCAADGRMLRALREPGARVRLPDPGAPPVHADAAHADAWGIWYDACADAVLGAIFSDGPSLSRNAGLARAWGDSFQSLYGTVWSHWMSGLAAAWALQQDGMAQGRAQMLAELDAHIEWLRQRAIDAPFNFRHMHLHLLGERGWAMGEGQVAARRFDEALGFLEQASRPWHRALITERAARLHGALGWPYSSSRLLLEAQGLYMAWGATAKAAELSAQTGVPTGAGVSGPAHAPVATPAATDDVDTLAVLRAAQALNTERIAERLAGRVKDVLTDLTGATHVMLALWDEEAGDWLVDGSDGPAHDAQSPPSPGELLPWTAVRHAERTGEPLLLDDAVADGRFGTDAHFLGVAHCALLVVPVLQPPTRAMLVLENRLEPGAFGRARLDAVVMIANQLAASLDNARLQEQLERKARQQTQQLRDAQAQLLEQARLAGMSQIAINLLHNVGNLLNNVNVSVHVMGERARQSRIARIADLAGLLDAGPSQMQALFGPGGKGALLPDYVRQLAQALASERAELLAEIGRLVEGVGHIQNVVALQQSYAGVTGVQEPCSVAQLVEDALRIHADMLTHHGVRVNRNYAPLSPVPVDRPQVLRIVGRLVENACRAMADNVGERTLDVAVHLDQGRVTIRVGDRGHGIAADHLSRMFSRGFSTRPGGHGLGLHGCALGAREMGGSLTAHSDGPGAGATFVLRL